MMFKEFHPTFSHFFSPFNSLDQIINYGISFFNLFDNNKPVNSLNSIKSSSSYSSSVNGNINFKEKKYIDTFIDFRDSNNENDLNAYDNFYD